MVGESASEALTRELEEEIGVKIEPDGLCAVVETTFEHGGTSYQEIGLYFIVDGRLLPTDSFARKDGNLELEFRWFPVSELEGVDLRPACLIQALRSRGDTVLHLVQRET
jgi:8-oxo-dGTP pyrophosphatase MutT (NUDIX family)